MGHIHWCLSLMFKTRVSQCYAANGSSDVKEIKYDVSFESAIEMDPYEL